MYSSCDYENKLELHAVIVIQSFVYDMCFILNIMFKQHIHCVYLYKILMDIMKRVVEH